MLSSVCFYWYCHSDLTKLPFFSSYSINISHILKHFTHNFKRNVATYVKELVNLQHKSSGLDCNDRHSSTSFLLQCQQIPHTVFPGQVASLSQNKHIHITIHTHMALTQGEHANICMSQIHTTY